MIDLTVSADGNDGNPGTESLPLASIAGARDLLRKIRRAKPAQEAIVSILPGTYFLPETVRFDDRDSRSLYRAAPGGDAVFYGGLPVSGWEEWRDGIYRARVPAGRRFYRLFENGRSATLAQYPRHGSGYGQGLEPVSDTEIKLPPFLAGCDFSDAQLFGFLGENWFSEMRPVCGHDRRGNVLRVRAGSGVVGSLNRRVRLLGLLEQVSQPGDWCLKHREGRLYYMPMRLPVEAQLIVYPTAQRVVEIRGRGPSRPAHDITVEGIRFIGSDFCENWTLSGDEATVLRREVQHGLIYMENAEAVTVRYCGIEGAGHSAVFMNHAVSHCTVYGCRIENAAFCGVYMNGWAPGEGGYPDAQSSYVNRFNTISNNYIAGCGRFVGHGCGIQFFQSGDNVISHNVITQMPRYGISYKGVRYGTMKPEYYGTPVTFGNHASFLHTCRNRIFGNDIGSVCRDSYDFGGIEAWGAGQCNVWENNAIHDLDQTVEWNGWGHALFLDDATHSHTVRGNIVYECKGGKDCRAIMVKSLDTLVENNIVADNELGAYLTLGKYIEPSGGNVIRRNIFSGEANPPVLYALPEQNDAEFEQIDYNLFWPGHPDLDRFRLRAFDRNSLSADPGFPRRSPWYERQYGDYALPEDSPALALGIKPVDMADIGLREDFPFDRDLLGRRSAQDVIQAESYDRMRGIRTIGGTGVISLGRGGWTAYRNVDFGQGVASFISKGFLPNVLDYRSMMDRPLPSAPVSAAFRIRLDAPDGPSLGTARPGETLSVGAVRGVHSLYIVFEGECWLDWFQFSC